MGFGAVEGVVLLPSLLRQNLIKEVVMRRVRMLKTFKMIKEDSVAICNQEQMPSLLDNGWELAEKSKRRRTPVEIEENVTEEDIAETPVEGGDLDRQQEITKAVKTIFDRNNSEEFTGGGLPRIEVIAIEAGIEDVTGQERSAAMEDFNLGE